MLATWQNGNGGGEGEERVWLNTSENQCFCPHGFAWFHVHEYGACKRESSWKKTTTVFSHLDKNPCSVCSEYCQITSFKKSYHIAYHFFTTSPPPPPPPPPPQPLEDNNVSSLGTEYFLCLFRGLMWSLEKMLLLIMIPFFSRLRIHELPLYHLWTFY